MLFSLIYKNDFIIGHLVYLRPCPAAGHLDTSLSLFIKRVTQVSVIYFFTQHKIGKRPSRYHTFI